MMLSNYKQIILQIRYFAGRLHIKNFFGVLDGLFFLFELSNELNLS